MIKGIVNNSLLSATGSVVPAAPTVWLTGLSGTGKSTIGSLVVSELMGRGTNACLLDGDDLRKSISSDLGFSREHRLENARRIGVLAAQLNQQGVTTVVAAITPYSESRALLRRLIPGYIEVHVDCPMNTLILRDPKGLYKKALAGEIANFTGLTAPYEVPEHPDLTIDTSLADPVHCAKAVFNLLAHKGIVESLDHFSTEQQLLHAKSTKDQFSNHTTGL